MIKRASYLLIAVFFLLTGCTLEQKLARTYYSTKPIGRFLLLEPDYLFKANLKTFEVEGYEDLDEYVRDSLLMERSLFMKNVSDSVVIKNFISEFTKTLEHYGAIVLPENYVDTVMENGGPVYILNMAQFSLEEFIHPFSSEQYIYDEVLSIEGFDVNAINYNVWLELGRMNHSEDRENKVLFNSDYLIDDVNGTLRQNLFTDKVMFDFTIDTITQPRINEFARKFGAKTAGYLFDYLMNTYITEHLPEDYPYEPYYYSYDPVNKVLYNTTEETRIEVLDNKK
jgi:hypothetical protein